MWFDKIAATFMWFQNIAAAFMWFLYQLFTPLGGSSAVYYRLRSYLVRKGELSFTEYKQAAYRLVQIFRSYRFPRVFGDEFGDEFGDSLNFVSKLVTHLVMISVNHCIW